MWCRDLPLITWLRGINCLAAVVAVVLLAPVESTFAQHALTLDVNCPQGGTERDEPFRPIYYPHLASASNPNDAAASAPESLLKQFMQLHTASRYEDALAVADELVAMVPGHPLPHYNRACALARLQRTHDALDALERAIEHGWRDVIHLKLDPDLQSIRWHERYATVVALLGESLDVPFTPAMSVAQECDASDLCYESLEALIPQWLEELHVPGASVSIVRKGSVTWSASFGMRDRSTGEKLTPSDQFVLALPQPLSELMPRVQCAAGDEASIVTGHTWMGTPISDTSTCVAAPSTVLTTAEQFSCSLASHFADRSRSARAHDLNASGKENQPHVSRRVMMRPVSLEQAAGDRAMQQWADTSNGLGWYVRWNQDRENGVVVFYNADRGDALATRIAAHVMPSVSGY